MKTDWLENPWGKHPVVAGLAVATICAACALVDSLIPPIRETAIKIAAAKLNIPSWAFLALLLLASALPMAVSRRRPKAISEGDIRAALGAWARGKNSPLSRLIYYKRLDRKLRLPSGSAKRLLPAIAAELEYQVADAGEHSIRFRYVPRPITMRQNWGSF